MEFGVARYSPPASVRALRTNKAHFGGLARQEWRSEMGNAGEVRAEVRRVGGGGAGGGRCGQTPSVLGGEPGQRRDGGAAPRTFKGPFRWRGAPAVAPRRAGHRLIRGSCWGSGARWCPIGDVGQTSPGSTRSRVRRRDGQERPRSVRRIAGVVVGPGRGPGEAGVRECGGGRGCGRRWRR